MQATKASFACGPVRGSAAGERALLELMSEPALTAYRTAAFQAIEACREPDGALHWRPEVVYAVATPQAVTTPVRANPDTPR